VSETASLFAALGAGFITFLSPCVLPLIPGYVAFMTGMTTAELTDENRKISAILIPSLLFVLGFSIVFVALGASASAVGSFLSQYSSVLEKVAGAIILLLGFFMLGIIKVPWLYGEARFEMQKAKRFGSFAALLMGMAFAFGWSPCVGPVLGSILMVAANSAEVGRGALLLAVYSLGLGIPFILVALLLGRVKPVLNWLNRHTLIINRVAGIILMILGLLILTGWIGPVVGWLSMFIPKLGG